MRRNPFKRSDHVPSDVLAAARLEQGEPSKPAPTFALPDLDGKVTRLEDLRGKVVLLFFWATW